MDRCGVSWKLRVGWNKPAQPQMVIFGVIDQHRPGIKTDLTCKNEEAEKETKKIISQV